MQRAHSCHAPRPGDAPAITAPARARRRRTDLALAAGAVICALMAPPAARAAKGYSGNVVAQCGTFGSFSYNVVASITGKKYRLADLSYEFIPSAQTTFVDDDQGLTRYFQIIPGTYTVDVMKKANVLLGVYSVTATSCASSGAGMTWSLLASNATDGVILVGCGNTCNAYNGDTACATALPLLCILKDGPGFPLPLPASVNNGDIYDQWAGGIVGTTAATVPPATLAGANAFCTAEFGANWRVAEFHDGWGWNFQAYGYVGEPATRFWVHIDDQPGATCWH